MSLSERIAALSPEQRAHLAGRLKSLGLGGFAVRVLRGDLPRAQYAAPEVDDTGVGQRTPAGTVVARIWTEVLKLAQVGIHASFFQLGAHSLLATQFISRLRARLRVDVPLPSLVEAPTITRLEDEIDRGDEAAESGPLALLRELKSCRKMRPHDCHLVRQGES